MASSVDIEPLAIGWVLIAFSGIFIVLRIFTKIWRRKGFWWDDGLVILAWLCLLVPTLVINMTIVADGSSDSYDFDRATIMGNIFKGLIITSVSIVGAAWSKTSFCLTLSKVAESRRMRGLLVLLTTLINIILVLSAVFPWIRCTPVTKIWDVTTLGYCSDPTPFINYDIFAAGFSALMDFTLTWLPFVLLKGRHLKRREKIGVTVAMVFGIIAGISAAFRAFKISKNMARYINYDAPQMLIWTTIEVAATIMAASIPSLRFLVRDNRGVSAGEGTYRRTKSLDLSDLKAVDGRPRGHSDPPQNYGTYNNGLPRGSTQFVIGDEEAMSRQGSDVHIIQKDGAKARSGYRSEKEMSQTPAMGKAAIAQKLFSPGRKLI